MRLVVQRVKEASVTVDGKIVAAIGAGLLVLAGLGKDDAVPESWDKIEATLAKLPHLRIFPDGGNHMNVSLDDYGGEILLVSQFTLYADCRKGRRPSFTDAGNPDWARPMFDYFVKMVDESCAVSVSSGIFGADMAVRLCNWGPVTIWLDSANLFAS